MYRQKYYVYYCHCKLNYKIKIIYKYYFAVLLISLLFNEIDTKLIYWYIILT